MSSTDRFEWIVAYDVCDPKRLRKVYRTLRGYGDHLQLSVFRCVLSARQLEQLKAELHERIAPTEDQVLFVRVGHPDRANARATFTLGTPLTHVERVCHVV